MKTCLIFSNKKNLHDFYTSKDEIGKLIERNVDIKYNVVANDEFETGERKLLNFGHTIGHSIENTSKLPHGSAVSIGMVAACVISEKISAFSHLQTEKIKQLLSKYHLPVAFLVDFFQVSDFQCSATFYPAHEFWC